MLTGCQHNESPNHGVGGEWGAVQVSGGRGGYKDDSSAKGGQGVAKGVTSRVLVCLCSSVLVYLAKLCAGLLGAFLCTMHCNGWDLGMYTFQGNGWYE